MELLAMKMVVISAKMVVNPRLLGIRIMRCRGVTLVKEGGLCKRQGKTGSVNNCSASIVRLRIGSDCWPLIFK